MIAEKIKSGFIVVLLTCLIWVTAEQAVTKRDQVRVRLQIPQSEGDTIIEFLDEDNVPLADNKLDVKLTVEGTTGRVNQAAKLNSSVHDINTTIIDVLPEPGKFEIVSLKVRDLLEGKFEIDERNHFLMVADALPQTVNVKVTRLVNKPVPVVVYHRGQKLSPEKVVPETVDAYIIEGNNTEAIVELTDKQRQEATEKAITVKAAVFTPYRSAAEYEVSIRISPIISVVPEREINSPRFGVLWPYSMEGKYRIVIDEKSPQMDEYQTIQCRGDNQVLDSYYDSPVHLMIVITEEDLAMIDKEIARIPVYNTGPAGDKIEIINRKKTPIKFTIEKMEN